LKFGERDSPVEHRVGSSEEDKITSVGELDSSEEDRGSSVGGTGIVHHVGEVDSLP